MAQAREDGFRAVPTFAVFHFKIALQASLLSPVQITEDCYLSRGLRGPGQGTKTSRDAGCCTTA